MTEKPTTEYHFPTIGIVHSCFAEKFGIPRQPGLAPAARAVVEILPPYNNPAAFDGLQDCSHIWLQFVFHQSLEHQWRPRVRPPRLGGNRKLGVFATRSPVRPAAIGLSVVRLLALECSADGVRLTVSGADLVDGTPVLDIKPYVPYVDRVEDAVTGFADEPPPQLPVHFAADAQQQLQELDNGETLRQLIVEVLQQDPRPSYQATDPERRYGMKLDGVDVHWRYRQSANGDEIVVTGIQVLAP